MKPFVQRIHFVGVGGAGMSAIAELLHAEGFAVSGSDAMASAVTQRLAGLGITVFAGHAAAQVDGAQVVVASTAVKADNPELQAARARDLPVLARAEMLAELMRGRQGIAIAGTHGKTTTTSLVASVLLATGADPSFVIGGELLSARANARLGQGRSIVVEADESDASFLHLNPVLAVVTNIDADHMETYGHSIERLQAAFVDFIHRLPFYGRAVVCADDPGVQAVLPRLRRPLRRYGLADGADLQAVGVQALPGGQMRFEARQAGRASLPVRLNLAGVHNVRNALAAIAVARELELPDAPVAYALSQFAGVGRRFQRHGELPVAAALGGGSFSLVDDYGHHPAELAAVLAAARGAFPGRRLVAAFQPHRYTRTRDCFADFAAVLSGFDSALLTEVYAAGEAPLPGADGRSLAAAVPGAIFVDSVDALPSALAATARDGDVLLTLGAGSIGAVPQQLLRLLRPVVNTAPKQGAAA
jgi:UDP-N-acetylmuramate--alanine ligase